MWTLDPQIFAGGLDQDITDIISQFLLPFDQLHGYVFMGGGADSKGKFKIDYTLQYKINNINPLEPKRP